MKTFEALQTTPKLVFDAKFGMSFTEGSTVAERDVESLAAELADLANSDIAAWAEAVSTGPMKVKESYLEKLFRAPVLSENNQALLEVMWKAFRIREILRMISNPVSYLTTEVNPVTKEEREVVQALGTSSIQYRSMLLREATLRMRLAKAVIEKLEDRAGLVEQPVAIYSQGRVVSEPLRFVDNLVTFPEGAQEAHEKQRAAGD